MATTSNMFMYSLTIQSPTAVTQAILGQFAGTKEQQIVTASGSKLTIHRPDAAQGKVTPIYTQDVFGIIRSLAVFRIAGSNKGTLSSYSQNRVILVIRQVPGAESTASFGHASRGSLDCLRLVFSRRTLLNLGQITL
jgi:splicing factor 3B subunit 3